MIKISLTIMTSSTIEIDQRSVLHIVRTCFNIYLTTRSKINEATAQACLAQILQSIFAKMEQKMVRSDNHRALKDDENRCRAWSMNGSASNGSFLQRMRTTKNNFSFVRFSMNSSRRSAMVNNNRSRWSTCVNTLSRWSYARTHGQYSIHQWYHWGHSIHTGRDSV